MTFYDTLCTRDDTLRGRRSRSEGIIMHSTATHSPLPDNAHAPPTTILLSRSQAELYTLDGHRVRRGTGACARLEQYGTGTRA